ncbi:zf-HC2 domain-containing protein [Kribbella sp. NPDC003557]|uniref:anti-sigma factor family protein n=1 Tax=Kribbella sp. NPDC003557 TaxID=3154449 RepID=UPI0033B7EA16
MTHPLDKLSAVVDGQLDHDSREKVLSHLVGCDTCRAEVDAQRRLKARMAALETPDPSTDLMQRLMGVSSFSTEPREEVRPVVTPVSLFPQRSAFPAGRSTGGTRPGVARGTRSRRRAGVLGAAGSAAAVASLLGTAFVVGDPARSEQPPTLQPPVASFSSDHASTSSGAPFADPVALLNSYNGAGYAGLNPTLRPVALTGR